MISGITLLFGLWFKMLVSRTISGGFLSKLTVMLRLSVSSHGLAEVSGDGIESFGFKALAGCFCLAVGFGA